MKKCDEMGGIPYHINVVNYMVRAAAATKEYFIYQLICLLFHEYSINHVYEKSKNCRKMLNTISQNSFFFHYFVKPTDSSFTGPNKVDRFYWHFLLHTTIDHLSSSKKTYTEQMWYFCVSPCWASILGKKLTKCINQMSKCQSLVRQDEIDTTLYPKCE